MSKCINASADVRPKGSVPQLYPEGSRVGLFSLRRARYFNETGFVAAGRGVRDATIAEDAITEAKTELD